MPRWPLTAVGIVAAVVTVAAQDPPPQVFRGGVTTVPVYATVTDRNGGLILDVKREEFELRDNGKVQTITQFTADVQPLSMLVLIDGSGSMMAVLDAVIEAATSVIARMAPEDRTAIASFADVFQMRQPFTSDRQTLLNHLEDPVNVRVAGETRLWEALTESVLTLGNEPGRRVVLVLTDGKQWTSQEGAFGLSATTESTLTQAPASLVSLALDRGVLIYAIAVWTHDEPAVAQPSQAVETLAAVTGGGYVEMKKSDRLNTLASEIMVELHQQYVLGFTPQVLDGKTHKLDVRVKRPGLTVRARRSYFAPKLEQRH